MIKFHSRLFNTELGKKTHHESIQESDGARWFKVLVACKPMDDLEHQRLEQLTGHLWLIKKICKYIA